MFSALAAVWASSTSSVYAENLWTKLKGANWTAHPKVISAATSGTTCLVPYMGVCLDTTNRAAVASIPLLVGELVGQSKGGVWKEGRNRDWQGHPTRRERHRGKERAKERKYMICRLPLRESLLHLLSIVTPHCGPIQSGCAAERVSAHDHCYWVLLLHR